MAGRLWVQGEMVRSAAEALMFVERSLTQAPNWANPADVGDADVAGAVESLARAAKRAAQGAGHLASNRARQAREADAAFRALDADAAAGAEQFGPRSGS